MIVVADTSPLNYLVLIEQIHLLAALYGRVLVPPAVVAELNATQTPERVRYWIQRSPPWLETRFPAHMPLDFPEILGPGEREAIALSQEIHADALLIDDWEGRQEAARRQLTVVGTLRVLGTAAEKSLVHLPTAISRLRATNFRASTDLLAQLLDQDRKRKS
jgi:predicted nucleic acid-binding protein